MPTFKTAEAQCPVCGGLVKVTLANTGANSTLCEHCSSVLKVTREKVYVVRSLVPRSYWKSDATFVVGAGVQQPQQRLPN